MVFAALFRLAGIGAVGGAAYTAGYTHKSSDQLGEWVEGVSSVGQEVGQGFGAILGSVRDGLSSQARIANPPAPTITHVYHDRGSERSSLVPILVVTAGGVTCYWVVCWYKGWDFFGMSHARTQQLITNFHVKFQQYADQAKGEIEKLRQQLTNSEEAQKRHAETLKSVEGLVENANVELADVNLRAEDIAKAMDRFSASAEAQQRGTMAIQYFLAAIAAGGVEDREHAMRLLETSFKEMGATLPSQLLQESERKKLEQGDTRPDATGSSSSIAAALSRSSQLVTAPVRSIASFLWPSAGPAGGGSQAPQLTTPPTSLPLNGTSSSSFAGTLRPSGSRPHVVEALGRNPPSAIRGFGPGGRIPRDTAHEVAAVSPTFGHSKNRVTVEDVSDEAPLWKGGSSAREDEEEFQVSIKRPVFF